MLGSESKLPCFNHLPLAPLSFISAPSLKSVGMPPFSILTSRNQRKCYLIQCHKGAEDMKRKYALPPTSTVLLGGSGKCITSHDGQTTRMISCNSLRRAPLFTTCWSFMGTHCYSRLKQSWVEGSSFSSPMLWSQIRPKSYNCKTPFPTTAVWLQGK